MFIIYNRYIFIFYRPLVRYSTKQDAKIKASVSSLIHPTDVNVCQAFKEMAVSKVHIEMQLVLNEITLSEKKTTYTLIFLTRKSSEKIGESTAERICG